MNIVKFYTLLCVMGENYAIDLTLKSQNNAQETYNKEN